MTARPSTLVFGVRRCLSTLLLMSTLFGLSDGITCYQCVSELHEACGHGFIADQNASSTISIDEYHMCATETTLNKTSGITVVERGIPTHPTITNQSDGCYQNAGTETKASRYCICSTDLCNSEPPPDANSCNPSTVSSTQLIFGIFSISVLLETTHRLFF